MRPLLPSLALLGLTLGACEEPFTPKAPFEPRPVVTCVVAGSGTYDASFSITATVAQTYDVPGLDPMANRIDPFDTAAVVELTMDGHPVVMSLSKTKRADTNHYTTPQFMFSGGGYRSDFEQGKFLLSITTKDGKHLSASTTLPRHRMIETDYLFAAGVTAVTVQPRWTFSWDNGQKEGHLYFPRLQLMYQIMENDVAGLLKFADIPLSYVERDGNHIPVYPTFTRELRTSFDFSAMTRAIASISEGDPVKSRYKIDLLIFTLIEYDEQLSNYYASSHGYLDQYSIRVDESTYSNIAGGIGIFGSSYFNPMFFVMKTQYVNSFGYRQ